METRKANVIFNKSGGTAGKGSYTNRLTLPTSWVKELGVTLEDREVMMTFDNGKIIIEKKAETDEVFK